MSLAEMFSAGPLLAGAAAFRRNAKRKGALVDLRPGPHEVVQLCTQGALRPMRQEGSEISRERAFADVDNFVRSPNGAEIEGNPGSPWPEERSASPVWTLTS